MRRMIGPVISSTRAKFEASLKTGYRPLNFTLMEKSITAPHERCHMPDRDHAKRDQGWLAGVRRGEEAAFEALFLAYYEDLCHFASQYVSHGVVEDLVQSIFLSLWRRREDLSAGLNLRAYLHKAVRNKALGHLDRRRVRERPSTQEVLRRQMLEKQRGQEGPEEALRRRKLEAAVQEALEALPERRRQVFTLSRESGLTYAEIAELLGISIKTVETQMGRALRFLERRLSRFLSVLL